MLWYLYFGSHVVYHSVYCLLCFYVICCVMLRGISGNKNLYFPILTVLLDWKHGNFWALFNRD